MPTIPRKKCRRCGKYKPHSKFQKAVRNKDGLGPYCMPCHTAIGRAWRKRNPEKRRAIERRYRQKNPGRKKLSQRIWLEKNRDKVRFLNRRNYLQKLGLTIEEYNSIVAAASGLCEICHRPLSLVLDHCHDTGRVRGMLCNHCNRGIGCFQDNIVRMYEAIEYIRRHRLRPSES